ncbi:MAG: sulfotransferase [Actinocatenispora sp.]
MTVVVLSVTGWCRSGSTVLGNVLGEVPGVFHAGELRYLWRNGVLGTGSNRDCGCGSPLLDCPLWSKVLEQCRPSGRTLVEHATDVVRAQAAYRTRHTRRTLRRPVANGWPDTLAAVYRAIATQTGARVIVDSSKYPADSALLRHLDDVEPAYLQLVRDPRGVAQSWLSPKDYTGRRGVLNSTWYWLGFNLAAEAVARSEPSRTLRIRYEDLTRDPRRSIGRALRLVGLSDADNPVAEDGSVQLDGNHTVTGNPNRFERGTTVLTEDRRWHNRLSRPHRIATTALALPLLGRYGYSRRP